MNNHHDWGEGGAHIVKSVGRGIQQKKRKGESIIWEFYQREVRTGTGETWRESQQGPLQKPSGKKQTKRTNSLQGKGKSKWKVLPTHKGWGALFENKPKEYKFNWGGVKKEWKTQRGSVGR